MIVELDKSAGFCFGVDNAINRAEELLKNKIDFYCLGQIVHNEMEVARLEKMGMKTIDYKKFKTLKNTKVLLRAHGEAPQTYKIAYNNNIELIDATCPIVSKFQNNIKSKFQNNNDTQIVIFGKKNHPEIIGLNGQSENNSIIIENVDEIDEIDFNKTINLYAQTTKSMRAYNTIITAIKNKLKAINKENLLVVNKTLCKKVYGRDVIIKEFAKKHDVIIFVSGKKSSNGKMLFNICKEVNKYSFFISKISELRYEWFQNIKSVGVSGATSTPVWQIQKIKDKIQIL